MMHDPKTEKHLKQQIKQQLAHFKQVFKLLEDFKELDPASIAEPSTS